MENPGKSFHQHQISEFSLKLDVSILFAGVALWNLFLSPPHSVFTSELFHS